jgi:hypothetical protein
MQRWMSLILVLGALAFPFSARAQTPVTLSSFQVQLWPEYDQPSVLVIYDFTLPTATKLPLNIPVRFPKDGNLIAVASQAADGSLLNTSYLGPSVGDVWQTITVQIKTEATYHLEYYEPLSKSGNLRQFAYLWPGDFAVDDFGITVRVPPDTTNITTNPTMESIQGTDGTPYLKKDFGAVGLGQQVPVRLTYTKTSDTLSASQQDLRPSQPLGANTPGRVMLSNYLPYILGVLGLALIIGGSVYFWQSSRGGRALRERRHSRAAPRESQGVSDVYCHQCGTRAQVGDRFCRVCGTKLRLPE